MGRWNIKIAFSGCSRDYNTHLLLITIYLMLLNLIHTHLYFNTLLFGEMLLIFLIYVSCITEGVTSFKYDLTEAFAKRKSEEEIRMRVRGVWGNITHVDYKRWRSFGKVVAFGERGREMLQKVGLPEVQLCMSYGF